MTSLGAEGERIMADGGSKVVSQATIDVLLNTEAGDWLAQQKPIPLLGAEAGIWKPIRLMGTNSRS